MKRLDEVITGMTELVLSGKTEDVKGVVTDALKFLKKYREEDKKLGQALNEVLDTEMQYYHLIEDLERNEPLTWEELQKMEGQPVWVESSDSLNRRRWMFVGEWFDDDEMRLFDMGYDYPDYVSRNGYESGTWQAYRKEKNDDTR